MGAVLYRGYCTVTLYVACSKAGMAAETKGQEAQDVEMAESGKGPELMGQVRGIDTINCRNAFTPETGHDLDHLG